MSEQYVPTREEVMACLRERRNWGRWGADDQLAFRRADAAW